MKFLYGIIIAFSMYSKIPMPKIEWSKERMEYVMCFFPLVGVVLDRFGQDVMLVPDGEEHFTVTVRAVVSPQFLGWLFGLGPGVKLLAPDWAAEAYRKQLAAVAEANQEKRQA